MWSVARRPRWIATLALALVLAAGFAALSQWQLARSISTGTVVHRNTETVVPLSKIATPQKGVTDAANARMVSVTGVWMPGDFSVLSDRLNAGTLGYWVIGHLSADTPDNNRAGLAVALGWTASKAHATAARDKLDSGRVGDAVEITGRYLAAEAAEDSDFEHGKVTTLSTARLVNVWKSADPAGIYSGYVVDARAASGLTAIYSPKPTSQVELNWLNIFYAVEWVVFAGFAIFLWYRLVRDAWEREREEAAEAEAALREVAQTAQVN
jgi:cytochrome oxidase assembly protein ShyY1